MKLCIKHDTHTKVSASNASMFALKHGKSNQIKFISRYSNTNIVNIITVNKVYITVFIVIEQVPYVRVLFNGILRLLLEIDRRL